MKNLSILINVGVWAAAPGPVQCDNSSCHLHTKSGAPQLGSQSHHILPLLCGCGEAIEVWAFPCPLWLCDVTNTSLFWRLGHATKCCPVSECTLERSLAWQAPAPDRPTPLCWQQVPAAPSSGTGGHQQANELQSNWCSVLSKHSLWPTLPLPQSDSKAVHLLWMGCLL